MSKPLVAIIGKPNAGKSSLLNTILNEERAIVSELAGTTRDTIEEFVNIKGISLKLIDTAGIRKTEDKIEEIGVNRAIKLSQDADLIIAIFDASKKLDSEDFEILNIAKNATIVFPLPTSPWSNLCIGFVEFKSFKISLTALCCASVSLNGNDSIKRITSPSRLISNGIEIDKFVTSKEKGKELG